MNTRKPTKLKAEHLKTVNPLTEHQKEAFSSYNNGQNLVLSGAAGTGKTFIASYLAFTTAMTNATPRKVVYVRSAVPTRDMGFLPGTLEEKEDAYTAPYKAIVNDLFEDKEAWAKLVQLYQVEFLTTSFIRGLTIDDSVVIIDEAQNMNYHELCSVITRLGNNTRLIICGDYYQTDFTREGDKKGLKTFLDILEHMTYFDSIEFTWEDIVRSGLVRDFLMTKELMDRGKL